jgi:hypothetical protein
VQVKQGQKQRHLPFVTPVLIPEPTLFRSNAQGKKCCRPGNEVRHEELDVEINKAVWKELEDITGEIVPTFHLAQ